jgi:hypothetical protein
MTFNGAARITGIEPYCRSGLGALDRQHRPLVRTRQPRSLTGSIHLDRALRDSEPEAARWDYGVGVKRRTDRDFMVWIEVHPASSSHVAPVLQKLDWLKEWLKGKGRPFGRMGARFVWIATGSVAFPKDSPKGRLIAQQGLVFRARNIDLDDLLG